MKDGIFYINTTEDFLYELLKSEENMQELKKAFEFFKINKFEIIKKEKTLSTSEQDLKTLKEIFNDELIVE